MNLLARQRAQGIRYSWRLEKGPRMYLGPEFRSIRYAKLVAEILEHMTGNRTGIESHHGASHRVLRDIGDHWEEA